MMKNFVLKDMKLIENLEVSCKKEEKNFEELTIWKTNMVEYKLRVLKNEKGFWEVYIKDHLK